MGIDFVEKGLKAVVNVRPGSDGGKEAARNRARLGKRSGAAG